MAGRKFFHSKLFLLGMLVVLGVSGYFFVQEIQRRYQVEKEIQGLENQVSDMEKGNQDLSNLIEYLRSPSFQEKEIRRKLSLQKPGEHVVILPDAGGAAGSSTSPDPGGAAGEANWRKWWDYFFGQKH